MEHDCTQETLKSSMQGTSGSWDIQCMAAFRSCQRSKEVPVQAHHALRVPAQRGTLGRDLSTAGLGTA